MSQRGRVPVSVETPLVLRHDVFPHQVQVGECEGAECPGCVLRQAAIANLREAPQVLDDRKGMFPASPRSRATLVDLLLVVSERPVETAAPVDPVANSSPSESLTVRLFPIRLISEDLPFLAME